MVDAVFFVPHQDDEILTQGAYIRQHVEANKDIRIIMTNTGENVAARERIEQNLGIELSVAACSKARDRETIDGLGRMGVPPDKILFENFENDGQYTLTDVKNMMLRHFNRWGGLSYKAHSWMDKHRDHHLLGRALEELWRAGRLPSGSDVRYSRSWRYPTAPLPSSATTQTAAASASAFANYWDAYCLVDLNRFTFANNPVTGPRYGIGDESTTNQEVQDSSVGSRSTVVHGPSSGYTSARRTEANNWLVAEGFEPFL